MKGGYGAIPSFCKMAATVAALDGGLGTGQALATGNVNQNVLPLPTTLSTPIFPP